jgi:hypothetical protein
MEKRMKKILSIMFVISIISGPVMSGEKESMASNLKTQEELQQNIKRMSRRMKLAKKKMLIKKEALIKFQSK